MSQFLLNVYWQTPLDIAAAPLTWDKIHIYRSVSENTGYNIITNSYGITIGEIDSHTGSTWVTSWDDPTTTIDNKDSYYYLIRYYNYSSQTESKFYLVFKSLNPREQRLVEMVKSCITPWISQFCTDDDIRGGLIMAMNAINMYPPTTGFTLDNFPYNMEQILLPGAAIFTLLCHYLGVALTDVSYTDMGFSLNIDRGAKIKTAVDTLLSFYTDMLKLAKLDYISAGSFVGAMPLPISLGTNLSRNILGILDIFNAMGR